MKKTIKNYALFLVGLFIASLGVAMSTKAGLGTSPVASVPYSVSLVCHALTFGWWLNILSVIQIAVQVILLRRKCKPAEIIIQTILAFVYGYLTDFSCYLLNGIKADTYPAQFTWMLLGCFVLALGIWIQLKGGVAMLPGEAMNRAISGVAGRRYENVKIFFDVLYIVVSAIISFIFFGRLEGVREGSIIAAVLIGNIIKFYNYLYDKFVMHRKTPPLSAEYKSIVDQDRASVVICNLEHKIIYMNPAAVDNYAKRGGAGLIGKSIFECHNEQSKTKIEEVVDWFKTDESHNIVYTFHNGKQNKDVYMVALRDEGKLIGYYEKHEYRDLETAKPYDLW